MQLALRIKYHEVWGLLKTEPVKFSPNPVKFMPLVFPAKVASQYSTIVSTHIVLQGLFPIYSKSTFTGSEDNTD